MRFAWALGAALVLVPAMTVAEPDTPPAIGHICGAAATVAPAV